MELQAKTWQKKPTKQTKKPSKIGQDQKLLKFAFAYILGASDKNLFLEVRRVLGCVLTQF